MADRHERVRAFPNVAAANMPDRAGSSAAGNGLELGARLRLLGTEAANGAETKLRKVTRSLVARCEA